MSTSRNTMDETRIAEEIVSVLPAGSVARVCCDDRDSIRYAVRNSEFKLSSVVLRRSSLRRLADDPKRQIKIEYLQRDLLAGVQRRGEFRYPRPLRLNPFRASILQLRPIAASVL